VCYDDYIRVRCTLNILGLTHISIDIQGTPYLLVDNTRCEAPEKFIEKCENIELSGAERSDIIMG
jgi:hypothetical protein